MSSPDLREILAKISDGVSVLAKDGEISFVNEKASKILAAADPPFWKRIRKAAETRDAVRFEYFHPSLNRWYEHQAYPGSSEELTVISRDITSRHRLEEALRASEDRFRRIVESNIIGTAVVETGIITEANDVFLQMLGYTRHDLATHQLRWRELTPPEFDESDAKARKVLDETGVFRPYEKEFIRKDGTRVPVLIGGVFAQKKLVETFCLVLDLSDRKRAEQRLRWLVEGGNILASSLECQKTFTELTEFIVTNIGDTCSIFIRENKDLKRIAASCAAPPGLDEPLVDLDRIVSTGQAEMALYPVSYIAVPIAGSGPAAGVLVAASKKPAAFDTEDLHLFTGLGHRAGIALDAARLYQESQRGSRLKDEFVAVVSHELRTPLTPILGGVYMLKTEPHNEKTFAHALSLIERNARMQAKIVDDLLDVTRALTGKLRLNLEAVDLGAVIREAVESVQPAADAKGIQVDVRLGQIHREFTGDPDRLRQVVLNLVSNSAKFTPKGGHILVELIETSGEAEIRVTDTGIGIESEFLPFVFERFRQADTSRTREHGGLGLGLAIVRYLVESHGGTVDAFSSGSSKGAVFVVRLPLPGQVSSATSG